MISVVVSDSINDPPHFFLLPFKTFRYKTTRLKLVALQWMIAPKEVTQISRLTSNALGTVRTLIHCLFLWWTADVLLNIAIGGLLVSYTFLPQRYHVTTKAKKKKATETMTHLFTICNAMREWTDGKFPPKSKCIFKVVAALWQYSSKHTLKCSASNTTADTP